MATGEDTSVARRVGQNVDKYRLLRVLGTGGMGAVYEAEHSITGKHVALKLLHKEMAESQPMARRFLREARAASSIKHPAIADVLDAGQLEDGALFLVLELLHGCDLARAISQRSISRQEVVQAGVQVLEALDAAHREGFIHRDIKPENIFLTRDGRNRLRVKLLDFGIAKQITPDLKSHDTKAGTVLGTPHYMSPEQATGIDVTNASDLWAVGAVLFFAFTGRPPFDGDNYAQLIIRIVTESPPSLGHVCPDLPAGLVEVVDRALEKDVSRRWSSAGDMLDALRTEGSSIIEGHVGVPQSDLPPPMTPHPTTPYPSSTPRGTTPRPTTPRPTPAPGIPSDLVKTSLARSAPRSIREPAKRTVPMWTLGALAAVLVGGGAVVVWSVSSGDASGSDHQPSPASRTTARAPDPPSLTTPSRAVIEVATEPTQPIAATAPAADQAAPDGSTPAAPEPGAPPARAGARVPARSRERSVGAARATKVEPPPERPRPPRREGRRGSPLRPATEYE